jgi:hypothetical protein
MVRPRIAMIQVQNLDPILLQRNGPTMHITGEYAEAVRKARLGETKGKWKILSGIEGMEYETREMTAGIGGGYLTKDRFTLTREDVFGKKEAK